MNADDPGADLVELHRWLAALVNPQCHYDLREYPEIERLVEIEDLKDEIERRIGEKD